MAVLQSIDVRGWRSRWAMMIVLLGTLLFGSLMAPAIVGAHAQLVGTTPTDGVVLETQPRLVTLNFNESVHAVPGGMQLFDSDGLIATLDATTPGQDIDIFLPDDLADGTYVVGWRTISADSHPISGALTFSIGEASATAIGVPEDSSTIMPVMGTVTGIAYLTLLLGVGIIWFRVFIVHSVDQQSIRIATIATIISSLAHLLLIPLTTIREVGESVTAIVDPDMWDLGPLSLTLRAFLFVAIGLAVAIRYASTANTRRLATWGVSLGGLLALGSLAVVGHTTTVGPTALVHGADFIHGIAGATWFGGLVGLAIYLTRSIRGRSSGDGPTPAEATEVVARFSWIAGLIFVGLALSGGIMAVRILETWDALLHTTYGKVLIAKLIVVIMPFLVATWNRLRLVPAVERAPDAPTAWNRLRMAVLLEGAFLVAILGISGFLVLQNPTLPAASASEPSSATVPFEQTAKLGDGTLQVRIDPASTGDNEITLTVLDGDGNPIELVNDADIRLTLPSAQLGPLTFVAMATDEPGQYAGQIQVPMAGEWTIEVVTRVSRFEEPITTFTLPLPYTSDTGATASPVAFRP